MVEEDILTAIHSRLARELALAPVDWTPLRAAGHAFGWVDPARAARLAAFRTVLQPDGEGLVVAPALATCEARTAALDAVTRTLAAEGCLSAWRDERFAVARAPCDPPLLLLERAAARYFGIRTEAAHVNGTTAGQAGPAMWIARRSPGKPIDPGQLDNLVGGGIAAGLDARATMVKESGEEAGIPPALAARAVAAGTVRICRSQPDGLQRETVHVFDLALPPDFLPQSEDGEVVEHRLVPVRELAALIACDAGPGRVTTDASLVILDWLLRHGGIDAATPLGESLSSLRFPAEFPG